MKDIASTDINRFVRDVTAGRTKANVKTKARGRAIVRGGAGTAARAVGLLGGIFTYAIGQGIIEKNPAHGIRKQADRVKDRRLTEQEYRELGAILRKASKNDALGIAVAVARFLALTGCRRSEAVSLKWTEVDAENSCLRLEDSKEGASVRPVGLSVLDMMDDLSRDEHDTFVFPGTVEGKPLVGFPKYWKKVLKGTILEDITPHVLRHSFASVANDLGFTEATVAALLGHSRGTVTSRYIHTVDTALIMAADTIAGSMDF